MNEDWLLRRERVLVELAEIQQFDRSKENYSGGYKLWLNDWLQEDLLLLLEAKENLTEDQWKDLLNQLRGS